MLIYEMTEDECGTALEQGDFGKLACARGDQPYIVPIYFSYDRKHLYGDNAFCKRVGPTALPAEITDTSWKRFFEPSEALCHKMLPRRVWIPSRVIRELEFPLVFR